MFRLCANAFPAFREGVFSRGGPPVRSRNDKEETIMLQLFVNAEGGLTTAGYVLSGALMALFLLAGLALSGGKERKGMSARHLAYCAMAVALRCPTAGP